jgi:hypothetical protein
MLDMMIQIGGRPQSQILKHTIPLCKGRSNCNRRVARNVPALWIHSSECSQRGEVGIERKLKKQAAYRNNLMLGCFLKKL